MPTYDWVCPDGHTFEIMCSVSNHAKLSQPPCVAPADAPPGPVPCGDYSGTVPEGGCGKPSRQMMMVPFLNNTETMILDYPGSKRLKAGHVHYAADIPATRVQSGYGGMLNPSHAPLHPAANWVTPEWKVPK